MSGVSEASKVLFNDPDPINGFVILPDMKWDGFNVATLYLVAISRSLEIESLRDLRKEHLYVLKRIRHEAERVVRERWGVEKGGLRFYVHYQPSYCEAYRLDQYLARPDGCQFQIDFMCISSTQAMLDCGV